MASTYVIMSASRAHCYPNFSTWALVRARAERMGVKGLEAFRPQMSAFKTRKTAREVEDQVDEWRRIPEDADLEAA